MNVVAVYGSARKNGNGAFLVEQAISEFREKGIDVKRYYLPDMNIQPCAGCFACRKKEMCIRKDDMSEMLQQLIDSDYVIFETPIYMYDASGCFRMMMNRMYTMLDGKPGFYTKRHPGKHCMLIMTQGAPLVMFSSARWRIGRILKSFGFCLDSVVSMGFANNLGTAKKRTDLIKRIKKAVDKCFK